MKVSLDDLKLVSNYVESKSKNQKLAQLTYMDMIETTNEEWLASYKRKKRDNRIDALLNGTEEKEIYDYNTSLDFSEYPSSITPVIKTITLNAKNYLDPSDILNDILGELESQTSTKSQLGDVNKVSDLESLSKSIISKITQLNYHISKKSRLGPAKTIILGLEAWEIIKMNNTFTLQSKGISPAKMMGMDIIPTNKISPNKVIVMRVENQSNIGLNLVNSINEMRYYLGFTPDWERQINWFNII
jgi:hypothetical protein